MWARTRSTRLRCATAWQARLGRTPQKICESLRDLWLIPVLIALVAQLDRALASGAKGCGFDPRRAHVCAKVSLSGAKSKDPVNSRFVCAAGIPRLRSE